MRKIIFTTLLSIIIASCSTQQKTEKKAPAPKIEGNIMTIFWNDGSIQAKGKVIIEKTANIKNDQWTFYYKGTKGQSIMAIGNFNRNKKDGVWKYFYQNGTIKAEGGYKENIPEGTTKTYYSNGKIQSISLFKDGKLEGVRKIFNKQGKISSETPYVRGKISGMKKTFYPTGEPFTIENILNGKKNGVSTT